MYKRDRTPLDLAGVAKLLADAEGLNSRQLTVFHEGSIVCSNSYEMQSCQYVLCDMNKPEPSSHLETKRTSR
jgi:hypothetical protein